VSGALWSAGDFTGDGKVDAFDLNLLAANWQFGAGASLDAALTVFPVFGGAAVPEPGSLAMLALGVSALLGSRRWRHGAPLILVTKIDRRNEFISCFSTPKTAMCAHARQQERPFIAG
jgi:hypothetical protein